MILRELFELTRPIGRLYFLAVSVALSLALGGVGYLTTRVIGNTALIPFLVTKSVMDVLFLVLLTPFAIRRLRDFGGSPLWALLLWLAAFLGMRNLLLYQEALGVTISPIALPVLLIQAGALILSLALLLWPGKSRSKSTRDADDTIEASVGTRMASHPPRPRRSHRPPAEA